MRIKKSLDQILFLIVIMLGISLSHYASGADQGSGLVAPGATLKTVHSGLRGTEGPAVDADGNVYFPDMFENKIYKWTWADGKVSLYREHSGTPNGMMFDAKGNLVVCEMSNNRVVRDDMKGNITVLADFRDGKKVHSPNDLWIDSKGGIYFSEFNMGGGPGGPPGGGMPGGAPGSGAPGAGMPGGTPGSGASSGGMPGTAAGGNAPAAGPPGGGKSSGSSQTLAPGELGIDYITPDGKKVIRVMDCDSPNGLIGTSDGKILYFLDKNKIWSCKISPDGSLTDKKVFCESNTDGMVLDEKGNLYLASDKAILIYSPDGKKIEEFAMPEGIANLKFAGKDRKTLFITYHGNVYTLEMTVKGAPLALDLAKQKK
jgi:gluconolactonase